MTATLLDTVLGLVSSSLDKLLRSGTLEQSPVRAPLTPTAFILLTLQPAYCTAGTTEIMSPETHLTQFLGPYKGFKEGRTHTS